MKRYFLAVSILALVLPLIVVACAQPTSTPVPTATPAPTATRLPTATPTPQATLAPGVTPTATLAPTATPTATRAPTPTVTQGAKPEGVLRVARSQWQQEGLDPVAAGIMTKSMQQLLFNWLVGITPDGQDISPDTGLANKWTQAADGLSWTFLLRKGVQWDKNNGEVTAEDVKFSVNRTINTGGTVAPYASALKAAITEIQVVDPYTVKFVTKSPVLTLPYDLSQMVGTEGIVYPKKYVETVGDKGFGLNPIGSGPYRLVKWETGQYFRFEAREEYWQFVPRYKEVWYYKVPEEATRLAMLKRGELDVADLTIPRLKEVEAAGFKVFEKPEGVGIWFYIENQWEGYLADARVRLALNLAVNKQEILNSLFQGKGRLMPAGVFFSWAPGSSKFDPFPFDPKRAKALLAEAGYPNGIELEIISTPGDPLPLVSEAVAGYLEAVGIKTKITPMDNAAASDRRKKFDVKNVLAIAGVPNRLWSYPTYRAIFHSKANLAVVRDPKMDALLDAMGAAKTVAEYAKYNGEIEQYLKDNVTQLYVVYLGEYYAVNPKLAPKEWAVGGKSVYDMGLSQMVRP